MIGSRLLTSDHFYSSKRYYLWRAKAKHSAWIRSFYLPHLNGGPRESLNLFGAQGNVGWVRRLIADQI